MENAVLKTLSKVNKVVSERRREIIIGYFFALVAFFFVEFYFFQNWDMLVRILNANYLFHNGFYFENQRALLESVIIGAFSFVAGSYAVYAMMLAGTALLFFSLRRFSNAFGIDFLMMVLAFFNPFSIVYIMKNGSEIFLIAFLFLFLSSIKRRDYLAGLFLAFAFVSKYDALYFTPLLLFYLNKDTKDSIKRILINICVFVAALVPFFLYNLFSYGNMIYTLALAYFYAKNVGSLPSFNFNGFVELAVPAILLLISLSNKRVRNNLRRMRTAAKNWDFIMLMAAGAIGMFTYVEANGFFLDNLGVYRFFILPLSFLTAGVVLLSRRKEYLPLLAFAVVSFIIASVVLYAAVPAESSMTSASFAKSVFYSAYNTTNCTVASNDWVYLDHTGLPAGPYLPQRTYTGSPIVSFGPVNTGLPLVKRSGNVYVYGLDYCSFHKELNNFLTMENMRLAYDNKTLLEPNACQWLFGGYGIINSTCTGINDLALGFKNILPR